jgi:hypothetical protein
VHTGDPAPTVTGITCRPRAAGLGSVIAPAPDVLVCCLQ